MVNKALSGKWSLMQKNADEPKHIMTKMRKKGDLPSKPCATCGRPFTWRKKWEKVWDEVRHCSDRCRAEPRAKPKP